MEATIEERIEKGKLNALIKMAGAVCHEMSQPVQALNGYIGLIKMDPQKYATTDYINKMEEQIERMFLVLEKIGSIECYKTKPYLKEKIVDIDASSSSSSTVIGGISHEQK